MNLLSPIQDAKGGSTSGWFREIRPGVARLPPGGSPAQGQQIPAISCDFVAPTREAAPPRRGKPPSGAGICQPLLEAVWRYGKRLFGAVARIQDPLRHEGTWRTVSLDNTRFSVLCAPVLDPSDSAVPAVIYLQNQGLAAAYGCGPSRFRPGRNGSRKVPWFREWTQGTCAAFQLWNGKPRRSLSSPGSAAELYR